MAPLTRNSSLAALSGLPEQIKTVDDLKSAVNILRTFVSTLELQPVGLPTIAQTDLVGVGLQKLLKTFVPKIAQAMDSNIQQSKALAKVLATINSAVAFLDSPAYEETLVRKVIDSGLMAELIEEKVKDKIEGMGLGGSQRGRGGRSALPETPMRAARRLELEKPLHHAVHALVHKSYSRHGRTVVSDLVEWPAPEDEEWVEEDVDGSTVRRWRPDWEVSPAGSLFESAVVRFIKDEYEDVGSVADIKTALKAYMSSIARARKDAETGKHAARKAVTNMRKRSTTLLDNMLRGFKGSVLNLCGEREFYLAMINSRAFTLMTASIDEPHGLAVEDSIAGDGLPAQYRAFELYADLWYASRAPKGVVMAVDTEWWSRKARFAFWVLWEESKPEESSKHRYPLFHVPYSARSISQLADLPRLPVPEVLSTTPSPAKKQKLETFALTRGMVTDRILNDPAYETWADELPADPPIDDTKPPLEELLRLPDRVALRKAAESHIRTPLEMPHSGWRKLWKIREEGSEEMYLGVLRGKNPAQNVEAITEDDIVDTLYQ